MCTGSWGRGQLARGVEAVLERCVWEQPPAARVIDPPLHYLQHLHKGT